MSEMTIAPDRWSEQGPAGDRLGLVVCRGGGVGHPFSQLETVQVASVRGSAALGSRRPCP
jgi:hypothetical protein